MAVPQTTPMLFRPLRSKPLEFADEMQGFLNQFPTNLDEMNVQTEFNNQKAIEADASATLAGQHKDAANTSAAEALASKNEAGVSASTAVAAKNTIQSYVVPTDATYTFADIDAKLHALAPYSGYTKVAKKLDNFVFQEDAGFTNKVGDKNRFIKFGSKVIDTHAHASYDATTESVIADFSAGMPDVTEVITNGSNVTSVAVTAGDYVVDGSELVTNGSFDTDISGWSDTVEALITHDTSISPAMKLSNPYGTTAKRGAKQGIGMIPGEKYLVVFNILSSNSILEVNGVALPSSAVGRQSVVITAINSTLEFLISQPGYACQLIVDDISTKRVSGTFRAIQDTPIGTELTNATYFEDRTQLGVTNQVLAYHAYNTSTNSYEGILTEVVFDDIAKADLKDLDTVMTKAGFAKVSDYLYSKGDYHAVPMGIWQSLNKGSYHKFSNPHGSKKCGNDTLTAWVDWYQQSLINSTARCFAGDSFVEHLTAGTISLGYVGRENLKYYDIVYPDQFTDLRPFAKVLTDAEFKLVADDRLEHGVSESTVLMTTVPYDTAGNIFIAGDAYIPDMTGVIAVGQYLYGYIAPQNIPVKITRSSANPDLGVMTTLAGASIATLGTDTVYLGVPVSTILSSGTSLTTDLIGDPANYPALLTDRLASGVGVVGVNPLLVSDTGVNLIPDGTSKAFKASERVITPYGRISSGDSGVTWTYLTDVNASFVLAPNDWTAGVGATDIDIFSYTTKNHPLIESTPESVISVEPKVIASNHHSMYQGALIGNQVAGKVQVGDGAYEVSYVNTAMIPPLGATELAPNKTISLSNGTVVYVTKDFDNDFAKEGTTWKYIGFEVLPTWTPLANDPIGTYEDWEKLPTLSIPVHSAIALDASTSPASKYFNVLEEDTSGNAYLGVYGEEITYDGVGEWGDTDFSQLTNGTIPDVNGGADVRTFHGVVPIYGKVK